MKALLFRHRCGTEHTSAYYRWCTQSRREELFPYWGEVGWELVATEGLTEHEANAVWTDWIAYTLTAL